MVLISETELAALKAEIASIKSFSEETRIKLETMHTEAAASQLQITTSEPNSTSNTSLAVIPMSASSRKKRDSDITRLVHCRSQYLLGEPEPAMNKQFVIPAPLAAGAPIRRNDDQTVRYFNPPWEARINDPRNVEYFEAVHDSLMTDESHMDDDKRVFSSMTKKDRLVAIRSDWKSTGKRLKASQHSTVAARRKQDNVTGRRRGRKKQFTAKLRAGALILSQTHGTDACKGIEKLCVTDYADSQYSALSADEDGKAAWTARKVMKGGGTASRSDAVAVQRKRWIAPPMRMLWGAMLKAERDGPADITNKKSRAGTTSDNFKFRDVGANDNQNMPPMTAAGTPHKSCIRESWAQKNAHLKFKDDDPGMSVLALADTIDPKTLDPRNAAFWENDADDEYDEDSDDGGLGVANEGSNGGEGGAESSVGGGGGDGD